MNTSDIMNLALEMSGLDKLPDDSEIYVQGDNIKKVLFSIDVNDADIMLAKNLGYDAVINHHPLASVTKAYNVFKDNVNLMVNAGVPEEAAKNAVHEKFEAAKISSQSQNYDKVVSVARLLNMPLMNIHQPLDEIGRSIMQNTVDNALKRNPNSTLKDITDALYTIPEFKRARTNIRILLGSGDTPAGRVYVSHGAYTNGGYDIANACFESGINTVIYIHISYADYKKLKSESKGNLIVTGHIASDCVGINPFIEKLRQHKIEVTGINGII
ncbi:MAG TPA: hypothetical protein DD429_12245 [Clostridiaceae bacterium]|nr:hypothetical protein [Clostridiaceae bacterium]